MANAKIISLIDAELRKNAAQNFDDIKATIVLIDDEFEKIRNLIKGLEERIDLLEHQ